MNDTTPIGGLPGKSQSTHFSRQADEIGSRSDEPVLPVRLGDIAHARSGDKGNHANVGVIAYTRAGFEYLQRELTEARVAEFFRALKPSRVQRFELPGIFAYNYVLHEVLAGGASQSLRIDSQGKTLGLAILEMQLPRPDNIDAMRPVKSEG